MNNSFEFKSTDLSMIDYWNDIQLYDKINNKNKNNREFVFMDGPPFVSSSNLHLGHMLISSIKSIILNYKNMLGYTVINRIGYDCHGLPIEQACNKDLNISTKDEVIKTVKN
jgi:isoleucyl-tRNA synthetase